jgi:hypothetical protein
MIAMTGAKKSPFYNDHGKLIVYPVNGTSLQKVAEAAPGHWPRGVILVGNMVEKDVQVFAVRTADK